MTFEYTEPSYLCLIKTADRTQFYFKMSVIDYEAKAIVAKDAFQGSKEGEYNLIIEEEAGELLEQRHTGGEVDVVTIASGLKPDAPAAYLCGPSKVRSSKRLNSTY